MSFLTKIQNKKKEMKVKKDKCQACKNLSGSLLKKD